MSELRDLPRPNWSRQELVKSALLFVLLLGCFLYTFPRWADWNQNSHFDLVVAVVDHGTLRLDCCVANTGDYALFEGHSYSDKAPGLSMLGIPIYQAFKALASLPPAAALMTRLAHSGALAATLRPEGSGLLPDKIWFALGLTFTAALVVAAPAAALGVILFRFLRAFTRRDGTRLAVTLAYCLATLAFPYSNGFFSHQLAAVLLFAAFVLAYGLRPARSLQATTPRAAPAAEPAASPMRLFLIGLLLGYSVITEYPTVLIAALLLVYAFTRLESKGRVGWILAGGVLPGLLLAGYDYAIFRTPLPVGYHYSALWQTQHGTGFMSLSYPRPEVLWAILGSSYRGLFFFSPVLLLALPGFVLLWREGSHRAEVAVSGLAVIAFLLFNSSSSMWWGGFAVGPRYLIPMLPFLAWPMLAFLERFRTSRWSYVLFGGLAGLSLLGTWGLALAGQAFPSEEIRNPWPDYALPHLLSGDLARNLGMGLGLHSWWSLLPLALFICGIVGLLCLYPSNLGQRSRRLAATVAEANLSEVS